MFGNLAADYQLTVSKLLEIPHIFSCVTSIFTVSMTFTRIFVKRSNGTMSILAKGAYFCQVVLAVMSRIMCFVLFALAQVPLVLVRSCSRWTLVQLNNVLVQLWVCQQSPETSFPHGRAEARGFGLGLWSPRAALKQTILQHSIVLRREPSGMEMIHLWSHVWSIYDSLMIPFMIHLWGYLWSIYDALYIVTHHIPASKSIRMHQEQ